MSWRWVAGALFALALAGVGAGAWVLHRALQPADPAAGEVLFEVPAGAGLRSIASRLEARGLVRDARAVTLLARTRGHETSLRAGEFWLSAAWTPGRILDTLRSGKVATWELAVPEGFTAAMIAERVAAAGLGDAEAFLAWVRDPRSAAAHGVEGDGLEGYLFPETYHLPRGLSVQEIAAVMVDQFQDVWRELVATRGAPSLSQREVVILASIVEKETGAPAERPQIAAVFLNRMARGMRLETDPTVIYGIPDFDGNLRRKDLENPDNPYNTYKIAGLPPGPIANPGRASLAAVLDPADVDYLYFVSRNDGTHVFSNTYREHEVAVNEYQRRRSRR